MGTIYIPANKMGDKKYFVRRSRKFRINRQPWNKGKCFLLGYKLGRSKSSLACKDKMEIGE